MCFRVKSGFLLFGHEIGRRRCTLFLGSFIEAFGVCVSGRGPSTDTPSLLHCLFCGMVLDLGADEVFLTDLTRFLSDLSLVVAGDDFRFCSVLEAEIKGETRERFCLVLIERWLNVVSIQPSFDPTAARSLLSSIDHVARAESSRVNGSMIASSPVYVLRLGENMCSAIRA